MVVTNDANSRHETERILEDRLGREGRLMRHINLPWLENPVEAGNVLLNKLVASTFDLASISGFEVAFGNKSSVPEGLQALRSYRERLAQVSGCQIWWVSPLFLRSLQQFAYDLTRYFLLVERLPDRDESEPGSIWSELRFLEGRARFGDPFQFLETAVELYSRAGVLASAESFAEVDDRLAIVFGGSKREERIGGFADIAIGSVSSSPWIVRRIVEGLEGQGRFKIALEVLRTAKKTWPHLQ
jgi:hypothetical protein